MVDDERTAIRRPRGVALATVLLLVGTALAACGGGSEPDIAGDDSVPDDVPRAPADPDDVNVVLLGDSLMADVAPAVEAALDGEGDTTVTFELTPFLPRLGGPTEQFEADLAAREPDVVVLLLGGWEIGGPDGGPGDPTWGGRYRAYVENVIDVVDRVGADLVWLALPPTADPLVAAGYSTINDIVAAAAFANPDGVRVVDANPELTGGGGGYLEVAVEPDGTRVRLRKLDGQHLCPGGVVRVVRKVLPVLEGSGTPAVGDEWEAAAWSEQVDPPDACPAPSTG